MYTQEEIKEARIDDFRVYLRQVWDYLQLPKPTRVQNDIAHWLQHGPPSAIIEAFRGVGKSWITCAFVTWLLFLNPDLKILIVSANGELAEANASFVKQLITGMPLLQHLKPRKAEGDKDKAILFDVGPSMPSRDPSVKAAGIFGQITGSRADVIIVDDIETPKTSYSHQQRERLAELVKEFKAILKPGGRVIYLGTPQVEQTIYNRLLQRGYVMRVWPAEIPAKPENYHGRLAPFIQKMIDAGLPAGTPVDEGRFTGEVLDDKRHEYGASGYALQFMLDTNPADAEKHPLKTSDLVIHDCDSEMGHVKLVWGSDSSLTISDLPSIGFDGDRYVKPTWKSPEMAKYAGTVMAIDPSGRGQDETAYAIVRSLHGMLYLVDVGGFRDGFSESTLQALAVRSVRHHVNYIIAEENYGGGMFNSLLKPVLSRVAEMARLDKENPDPRARPPSFDEEWDGWSTSQKELRILDVLEPVMKSHRLVVDRRVIEADTRVAQDTQRYSLLYQMTRMARIKGCLPHEDRLEAVSMACSYFQERVKVDSDKAVQAHKQALLDEELKAFKRNAFTTHNPRLRKGARKRSKWRNW